MTDRRNELTFLFKHSSVYGLGNGLSRAVALLLLPLYTRYLTPTDYGVLELIEVTTGLVAIAVSLGITGALSRFYYAYDNAHDRGRLVCTVYGLLAFGSTIVLALAIFHSRRLAGLVLDSEQYTIHFRIALAGLIFGVFVDLGQSYLRMLYKSVFFVTLSVVTLVVSVLLNVFFIVQMELGVLGILYTNLITRVLVGIPLTVAILRQTGLGFSGQDARAVLSYSLPLLPSAILTAVASQGDRYFIKHYGSIADAGVYGLANKMGRVFHALLTVPFIGTFLPRRFQLAQERDDAPAVFRTIFDCVFFITLVASLTLAVFSEEIVSVMTTPAFYGAAVFIPVILLTRLVFGTKYHFDFGVLYSRKTQYYLYANLTTIVVQFAAMFVLIPAWGVWGAVCASLLATAVNSLALYVFSARLYPIPYNFARNGKLLTLAVAVYLLSLLLSGHGPELAIPLKALLLCAFVVLLPRTGIVSRSEISQVQALMGQMVARTRARVSASRLIHRESGVQGSPPLRRHHRPFGRITGSKDGPLVEHPARELHTDR
jgi:O-antigen/teichoic acid export membrane protein